METNRAIQELNNLIQKLNISRLATETHPDPGESIGLKITLEVTIYLPGITLLEELSMSHYP